MNIGDFAMSLIESGNISNKVQTREVARPAELPVSEVDISDVKVPSSMMDKVLQESFGVGNEVPEKVQEPQLSEQEIIQERIITLKGELVETINKLTELVSEMAGMAPSVGVNTTQNLGAKQGGEKPRRVTRSSKYRGRIKPII